MIVRGDYNIGCYFLSEGYRTQQQKHECREGCPTDLRQPTVRSEQPPYEHASNECSSSKPEQMPGADRMQWAGQEQEQGKQRAKKYAPEELLCCLCVVPEHWQEQDHASRDSKN